VIWLRIGRSFEHRDLLLDATLTSQQEMPPRSIATSFDRRIRLEARAALSNADRPSSFALMMSVGTDISSSG
jgi:hypothetical protein